MFLLTELTFLLYIGSVKQWTVPITVCLLRYLTLFQDINEVLLGMFHSSCFITLSEELQLLIRPSHKTTTLNAESDTITEISFHKE